MPRRSPVILLSLIALGAAACEDAGLLETSPDAAADAEADTAPGGPLAPDADASDDGAGASPVPAPGDAATTPGSPVPPPGAFVWSYEVCGAPPRPPRQQRFERLSPGAPFAISQDPVQVLPKNPQLVFALSPLENAVYRSTDGGRSYCPLTSTGGR